VTGDGEESILEWDESRSNGGDPADEKEEARVYWSWRVKSGRVCLVGGGEGEAEDEIKPEREPGDNDLM
jgi:hypothetical protein